MLVELANCRFSFRLCLKVLHSYFAGVRLNYMVADRNSSENHSDRVGYGYGLESGTGSGVEVEVVIVIQGRGREFVAGLSLFRAAL